MPVSGRQLQDATKSERKASSRRPRGLTIRAALLLGFGVTFGIWLFAGYYFAERMAGVENRATAVNARYVDAQELLSTVRSQVLLSFVYVDDALLDPDPRASRDYRRRIEETDQAVGRALEDYVPVIDSISERQRVNQLRREIGDLQSTMLRALGMTGVLQPREAQALLRAEITPKREAVIRVSEELQRLNRSAFVRLKSETGGIYGATQRRVWGGLGLVLAASLGIGLLATLYADRLEKRLLRQQSRDEESARDIRDLSAKLMRVQEEERRTIARELHDEIGQVLTAVKVELAVAQRAINAAGGTSGALDTARSMTDSALTSVRDLSRLLHPAVLDDLGLPTAIDSYMRGFGTRHGIRVELIQERMHERLTSEVESSAYRIVQEALTNVAKHGRATSCRVHLRRMPDALSITIQDDGVGFSVDQVDRTSQRRGLGLIGIRERVAELGGTMRLESELGRGTRLTVELPAHVRAVQVEDPVRHRIAAARIAAGGLSG